MRYDDVHGCCKSRCVFSILRTPRLFFFFFLFLRFTFYVFCQVSGLLWRVYIHLFRYESFLV